MDNPIKTRVVLKQADGGTSPADLYLQSPSRTLSRVGIEETAVTTSGVTVAYCAHFCNGYGFVRL